MVRYPYEYMVPLTLTQTLFILNRYLCTLKLHYYVLKIQYSSWRSIIIIRPVPLGQTVIMHIVIMSTCLI